MSTCFEKILCLVIEDTEDSLASITFASKIFSIVFYLFFFPSGEAIRASFADPKGSDVDQRNLECEHLYGKKAFQILAMEKSKLV